jgi:hypothetical protein
MSRRFAIFAFVILAAIGLYTAGWFYAAGRLESEVAQTLERVRARGSSAECTKPEARGYPFRIGLFCDGVAYSDPRDGIAVSGTGLRSAAQVYQPAKVVGELDSLSVDLRPAGLEIDLSDIRYSTHLARPLPELASVEGRGIVAGEIAGARLGTAETAQAHMRPRGTDLDLAGTITALRIDPAAGVAAGVPPVDGEWDLTLTDGVARLRRGVASLRGISGEIRTLVARSGTASLAVAGPVSIDAEGLVDAQFTVSVVEPSAILSIVKTAFPQAAQQLNQVDLMLNAMGERPQIPLAISKGVVRVAFFTIGRIPPLD